MGSMDKSMAATGDTSGAVGHMTAGVHEAVDKLADAATQAAATLEGKGRQLRDAQSRLTESCYARVREQPLDSLGAAVACGFVLGWLVGRR